MRAVPWKSSSSFWEPKEEFVSFLLIIVKSMLFDPKSEPLIRVQCCQYVMIDMILTDCNTNSYWLQYQANWLTALLFSVQDNKHVIRLLIIYLHTTQNMFSFYNMKILINILLIIIFVNYFGLDSLRRYKKKSVFIHQQEFIPEEKAAPGLSRIDLISLLIEYWSVITIIPRYPGGTGVKNLAENLTLTTGPELRESMENSGFLIGEILISSTVPVETRPVFSTLETWIAHSIYPPPNSITTSFNTTLKLLLSPHLEYFIMFTDKPFTLFSANPQVVPKTVLKVRRNGGRVRIYLSVMTLW